MNWSLDAAVMVPMAVSVAVPVHGDNGEIGIETRATPGDPAGGLAGRSPAPVGAVLPRSAAGAPRDLHGR